MFGFLPRPFDPTKKLAGDNPVELPDRQNKVGAARPSTGLSQPDIITKCADYFTHVDNRQCFWKVGSVGNLFIAACAVSDRRFRKAREPRQKTI
jgi:hypothetical protein